MQQVLFRDLGQIAYRDAWDYQEKLFSTIVNRKIALRNGEDFPEKGPGHHLIFCEHPHVYTLGKSGLEKHLLANEKKLDEIGATVFRINRGGDITYHGPGQIVGYPILDLDHFFTDIHKYLRYLEEAIILTLKEYGIKSSRVEGLTGVWLPPGNGMGPRKICALGVRCSRWVTMHGFAFNVNTDLAYFNYIVPCGIDDKAVTSMEKELGHTVDIREVKNKLKQNLADVFGFELLAD